MKAVCDFRAQNHELCQQQEEYKIKPALRKKKKGGGMRERRDGDREAVTKHQSLT